MVASDTSLPLLPDSERRRVLVDWNDTDAAVPAGTLGELFAAQVRRSPGAVAVVAGDVLLSYAELGRRAGRLARRLARLGVRAERPVGLLMERSADVVIAELAVVLAGGAYVPLDVRAPMPRLQGMFAETGAEVLLTDQVWAAAAGELSAGHLVVVDDEPAQPEPEPEPELEPAAIDPDNVAYVMYTSGSTGAPKGVAVRHRDVVALAFDRRFGGHERVLMHSPLAFDA